MPWRYAWGLVKGDGDRMMKFWFLFLGLSTGRRRFGCVWMEFVRHKLTNKMAGGPFFQKTAECYDGLLTTLLKCLLYKCKPPWSLWIFLPQDAGRSENHEVRVGFFCWGTWLEGGYSCGRVHAWFSSLLYIHIYIYFFFHIIYIVVT